MDKVTECLNALIEEMRESRAYQNYLWMEEKLEKDPDLKSRVDDYRIRNYRLQQSENVDLYDAVDSLERDSYALRKSEKANAYLEAELEVCKMVQKVQDCISEAIPHRSTGNLKPKIKRRAPMSEKKRDAGYRAALTGAKGTVRLLIYVCVILVIILAAKTSYQFGHDVFAEEPVASRGKGKEVTVQVRSGMEAKELGELLKDNGLIDESLLVFEVQYRLSGYYGGIKDGSYVLNTAQTVDEMLEILAGVNTEGQPSAE